MNSIITPTEIGLTMIGILVAIKIRQRVPTILIVG